jgi:hypothetical protein
MEQEKIALLRRLDRDKAHGWSLHRLGYSLRIAVVILVSFEEGLDVLRRDEANDMSE